MAEQKLRYLITGDATQLNGALNRASVRLKAFGQAATRVGKNLSIGLTAPITIAGTVAVNQAVKFEKLRTTLNVLTGSADEGARAFERLVQFSATTPFQLPDLVAVNNTLMGFGLSADSAFENLKKLGDIAGITGGNLNNIAIAFGQAAAEGRVMTRDLRQFINNGVPVIKILAQEMGVAEGQIMDLATQGKITFDVLERAFTKATASGGDFAGGTKILSQTLGGLLSTLKDNVNIALAEFGQAIAEAFNLSENIPKIAARLKDLTDKFKSLSPATQKTIILFTAAVAGIGPLLIILGKLSIGLGAVLSILPKVRVAFIALTTAMKANPFILVATAIAGVVLALQNMKKATDAAKLEAFGEDLKKLSIDEAEAKLTKLNKAFDENQKILDKADKGDYLVKNNEGLQVSVKRIKKENTQRGEQIKLLKDFINLKKEEQSVLPKPDSSATATTPLTGGVNLDSTAIKEKITQEKRANNRRNFLNDVFAITDKGQSAIEERFNKNAERLSQPLEATNSALKRFNMRTQEELDRTKAIAEEAGAIITGGFRNMAAGIGAALGDAISSGANLASALAGVLLSTLGAMAIQLGNLAIKIGLAMKAIKLSFKNPFTAIAAGIALIAVGKMIQGAAQTVQGGKVKKFAKGGIVSTPTLGLMAEYPGARSNPEVIAPLDRLKSMIGDSGGGRVQVGGEFTLRGQDLVVALQRANRNRDRIN